jgi:hypothetical protein
MLEYVTQLILLKPMTTDPAETSATENEIDRIGDAQSHILHNHSQQDTNRRPTLKQRRTLPYPIRISTTVPDVPLSTPACDITLRALPKKQIVTV